MGNVMEVLMEKFGTSRRGLELMNKYILLSTGTLSNGETQTFLVPYERWRVRALGYGVITQGATNVGVMEWGLEVSDAGANDEDAFGKLTEHASYDAPGDMYVKDNSSVLAAFDPLAAPADLPTWAAGGALLDAWQTKAGIVSMTIGGTCDLDVVMFALLEVG